MNRKTPKINMTAIARAAGVSQATVSRVLSGCPGVTPARREAVIRAANKLDYQGAVIDARRGGAARGRNFRLLMCPLPEQKDALSLSFFRSIIDGVREVVDAEQGALDVRLLSLGGGMEPGDAEIDGLFLVGYPSDELIMECRSSGKPFVVVSGDMGSCDADLVAIDGYRSSAELARYAVAAGRKSFGCIVTKQNLDRAAGFEYALRELGIGIDRADWHVVDDSETNTFLREMSGWIETRPIPEALLISLPDGAEGCKRLLAVAGRRDVLVMTYTHYADQVPGMARMLLDPVRMGRTGALRLLQLLDGSPAEFHKIAVPMKLLTETT